MEDRSTSIKMMVLFLTFCGSQFAGWKPGQHLKALQVVALRVRSLRTTLRWDRKGYSRNFEKRNETKYFEGQLFIFTEFKLVLVERHDRTVTQTQSLWIPLVSGDAIGIPVF